jgi:ABC-2 type transport system permease protein
MAGKLLGNVAGSLVIFAIYGLGGFFLLKRWDLLSMLPGSLTAWFLAFQLGAVLLFSSLFLVIGASVNQLKEAQTLLMPVWMMLIAPLMVWFFALRDPNGFLATALSFFPPAAPMMIILRLATGAAVPWWQPWLALILLLLTTGCVIWLAGKIYRASLLRGDTVRNFIQLIGRARAT